MAWSDGSFVILNTVLHIHANIVMESETQYAIKNIWTTDFLIILMF